MSASRFEYLSATLMIAGINAAFNAANGALGAAVLKEAGYADYDRAEAAIVGAIGSAIMTGVICLFCGVLDDPEKLNLRKNHVIYIASAVIESLIGYAVFKPNHDLTMSLDKVAAESAVGSAILSVFYACSVEFTKPKKNNQQANAENKSQPNDPPVNNNRFFPRFFINFGRDNTTAAKDTTSSEAKAAMDIDPAANHEELIDLEAAHQEVPRSPKR